MSQQSSERLDQIHSQLAYVDGSLGRACEYIDSLIQSYRAGHLTDAVVYYEWLRRAYQTLVPLTSLAQGSLMESAEIPLSHLRELNTRFAFAILQLQLLGETVERLSSLLHGARA